MLPLDLHHIDEVSEGGGNEVANLIPLCPNCHALYHRQSIPRESIRIWKMMIVSMNSAYDKSSIDDLFFLKKLPRHNLVISGDGVLQFKKLIASGLVNFKRFVHNGPQINYEVWLSEKGHFLLDAWKNGNNEELKKYL